MITLLHGDNIEASRNELHKIRASHADREVRTLEGKSLDTTTLTQALESPSLFAEESMVIVENLFTKLGRKTKSIEEFTGILRISRSDVLLWEEKEIGAGTVKLLGSSLQNKLFKIPVVIFQFLDNIKPGNTAYLLTLSNQLFANTVPEIVFIMLVRRIRQLMMLKDGVIPEGLQGWQTSRLTSQAKFFTMEQLIAMEKKLLDMEVSIKTGASPFALKELLEQWLISL